MENVISFYLGGVFALAVPVVFSDTRVKVKRALLWPYYIVSSAYFLFYIIVLKRDI